MGRVYRRNRTWCIDYAVDGRRTREAIGTSKKLAAAVLRERESETIRGEYNLAVADDLHIDSLVDKFLDFVRLNRKPYTHRRYRAVMEHFAEFLGEHREIAKMTDVRRHHVETYKSWRMGQISRRGRPPGTMHRNTINLELDILRAMFNFAVKLHGLRSNPVKNIERFKVVKTRPRVLSETEVAELSHPRGVFVRVCKKIGIGAATFHTLRHTLLRIF